MVERCTDAVTSAAGTTAFLLAQAAGIIAWIVLNATGKMRFDPYPFDFLPTSTSSQPRSIAS